MDRFMNLSVVEEAEVESDGTYPSPPGRAAHEPLPTLPFLDASDSPLARSPERSAAGSHAAASSVDAQSMSGGEARPVATYSSPAAARSPAASFHVARRLDMSAQEWVDDSVASPPRHVVTVSPMEAAAAADANSSGRQDSGGRAYDAPASMEAPRDENTSPDDEHTLSSHVDHSHTEHSQPRRQFPAAPQTRARGQRRTPRSDPRRRRRRVRQGRRVVGGRRHSRSAPRTRKAKPSARQRKPEWDSDKHDLSVYKLSPRELAARHRMFASPNNVLRNMDTHAAAHRRMQEFRAAVKRGDIVTKPVDKRAQRKALAQRAREYAAGLRVQGRGSDGNDATTPTNASAAPGADANGHTAAGHSQATTAGPTSASSASHVQTTYASTPTVSFNEATPASVGEAATTAHATLARSPATFTPAKAKGRRRHPPVSGGSDAVEAGAATRASHPELAAALAAAEAHAAVQAHGDGDSDGGSSDWSVDDQAHANAQPQRLSVGVGGVDDEDSEGEAFGVPVSPDALLQATASILRDHDVATASAPGAVDAGMDSQASLAPHVSSAVTRAQHVAASAPLSLQHAHDSTILSLTKRLAESESLLVQERAKSAALASHVTRLEQELRLLRSGVSQEQRLVHDALQQEAHDTATAAQQSWTVTPSSHVSVRSGDVDFTSPSPAAGTSNPQERSPPGVTDNDAVSSAVGAAPHTGAATTHTDSTAAAAAAVVKSSPPAALGPPRRVSKGVIHWFSTPAKGAKHPKQSPPPYRAHRMAGAAAGAARAPSPAAGLIMRSLRGSQGGMDAGVVVRVSPSAPPTAAVATGKKLAANRHAVWTPATVSAGPSSSSPPPQTNANPMSPPMTAAPLTAPPVAVSVSVPAPSHVHGQRYHGASAGSGDHTGSGAVTESGALHRDASYRQMLLQRYLQEEAATAVPSTGEYDDTPIPEPHSPVPCMAPQVPQVVVTARGRHTVTFA